MGVRRRTAKPGPLARKGKKTPARRTAVKKVAKTVAKAAAKKGKKAAKRTRR
jgi:hypothetical protein